jgi:hypothetical protein
MILSLVMLASLLPVIITERKRPRVEYKLDDEDDESAGPWATELKSAAAVVSSAPAVAAVVAASSEPAVAVDRGDEPAVPANMFIVEPDQEAEKWERVNERKLGHNLMPPRPARGSIAGEARSTFHGAEEKDYLGRYALPLPSTAVFAVEAYVSYVYGCMCAWAGRG